MITLRKLHKWLGLAIGLQLIVWVTSGTIISVLNHDIVSGSSTKQASPAPQSIGATGPLFPIVQLSIEQPNQVRSILLQRIDSRLVYLVDNNDSIDVYDAITGDAASLKQSFVERTALASYAGDGKLTSSSLLVDGSAEIKGDMGVWRVNFDDDLATRVYISIVDGSVLAHRNRYWKVVDFLLMLHFMDYTRQGSFNNIQIIIVGFTAIWLSIFGLILVQKGFTRKDFTWQSKPR